MLLFTLFMKFTVLKMHISSYKPNRHVIKE